MNRRGLLRGILAAGMAPAVAKAGILMPVRKIALPDGFGEFGIIENVRLIVSPSRTVEHWRDEMLARIHRRALLDDAYLTSNPPIVAGDPPRVLRFRRYMPSFPSAQ